VETSRLTLTIPDNVLTAPTEIKVSTADMSGYFPGDRNAATFLIDGLPRSYSKPIPFAFDAIRRSPPCFDRLGTENFIGSRADRHEFYAFRRDI